jgi:hypothetical protein
MEPGPEYTVGDQENRRPGRPVSYGLLVSGCPGQYHERTTPHVELPMVFFLQNALQLHQQR